MKDKEPIRVKDIIPPPGYSFDKEGVQVRHDEYGKWRVLDIHEENLIALNTQVIQERMMHRIRLMNGRFTPPTR